MVSSFRSPCDDNPTNKKEKDVLSSLPGKTHLTIGQDLFSIQEYVNEQYNSSLHSSKKKKWSATYESFIPAAVMVYTDIQTLNGLDIPIDYGSGIEYADGIYQLFFRTAGANMGLQVGLWLNGTSGCQDILNGVLDDNIARMWNYFYHSHYSKVFLRVGYEFDNPGFGYLSDPESYKAAFRKLVQTCQDYFDDAQSSSRSKHTDKIHCRDKVVFVWHSWAAGIINPYLTIQDFYPGDDVVDWIGVSIFQQFYISNSSVSNEYSGGTVQDLYTVLDFAKEDAHKPIIVSESTPFGGIFNNPHVVVVVNSTSNSSSSQEQQKRIWDQWFQPTFDLIEKYDISMFSYINCNWEAQPMWKNVGFGDTRILATDTYISQKWNKHVTQNPRFLTHPNIQQETKTHTTHHHCPKSKHRKPSSLSSSLWTSSSLVPPYPVKNYSRHGILAHDGDDSFLSSMLVVVAISLLLVLLFLKTTRDAYNSLSTSSRSRSSSNSQFDRAPRPKVVDETNETTVIMDVMNRHHDDDDESPTTTTTAVCYDTFSR